MIPAERNVRRVGLFPASGRPSDRQTSSAWLGQRHPPFPYCGARSRRRVFFIDR